MFMDMSGGLKKGARFQHFHLEKSYTSMKRVKRDHGMEMQCPLFDIIVDLILGYSGAALKKSRKFATSMVRI